MWFSSITDVLNTWNQLGVFSYVLPFLLIFAVVFAILQKSKMLGENRAVEAIIALAIGLLALQFDFVSVFFAEIFPKFGIGLAIFLVLLLLIGFFYTGADGKPESTIKWIGWLVGIGVVIWALTSWNFWNDATFPVGFWLRENFWSLLILAGIVAVIYIVAKSGGDKPSAGKPSV